MVANPSLWVKFFQAAGVPSSTAATYAHIFYENRMELDMLTDLNKEYLREMGITPMGDIIAILRHAKSVHEQNQRDKILSSDKTAAIPYGPAVPSTVTSRKIPSPLPAPKSKIVLNAESAPELKPARRVLPEHEGRYKITLPSGTTERSKEILAKKAKMYSDQDEQGVFERLQISKNDTKANRETRVTIPGLIKTPPQVSIFSRLGGKKEIDDDVDENLSTFSGILKTSSKSLTKIVKKPLPTKSQKVVLVKKIPAKAATMVADEYENSRKEAGQKLVSFSAEDEILEIESRKKKAPQNVKARLGTIKGRKQGMSSNAQAILHRTLKTVRLKPPSTKRDALNLKVKTSSMKSDEMITKKSIKSRLNLNNGIPNDVRKISDRIGRVKLSSRIGNGNGNGIGTGAKKRPSSTLSSASVFDRLGFTK